MERKKTGNNNELTIFYYNYEAHQGVYDTIY